MKVAVIGLGVAGRSTCLALARRGHEVTGFDMQAEGPADGSSRGASRIFRTTPGEGEVYVRLARRARELWRELERESGEDLLDIIGGLMLGPPESEFVQNSITLAKQYGHGHRLFDAKGLARQWHGLSIPSDWLACYMPQSGVLAADRACSALLAAARDAGAHLQFDTRIGVTDGPTLDDLLARFDKLVVAAGPWTAELLPQAATVLQTFRVSYAEFVMPYSPMPLICSDDKFGTYGLPVAGGRYKIGMDAVGEENANPDIPWRAGELNRLTEAFGHFFPDVTPRVKAHEACFYTRTPDLNFLVEQGINSAGLPIPGVLVLSCCSGHGFKYGPALGEIAADWVEGNASAYLDAFSLSTDRANPAAAVGEEDAGN